jgi:hypothetical protein
MSRTKFTKIKLEVVVEVGDAQYVKKLLRETLDTIHDNHTIFSDECSDKPTRRPKNADEYGCD